MLFWTAPAHAVTIRADDGLKPWAGELANAIQNQQWDQAHELANKILREEGYQRSGSEAVDWFINGERSNILGKVQQETIQEIVAKYGDDALEGIINVGSHARWNNLKFIPGKSDVDFIFVGKHSAEADELFRTRMAQEMGTSAEEALSLTKIGPSSDVRFNKLQEIKSMQEALQKGEQDVSTFLKRLDDPQYAEYYKTYGGDKFVETYNWDAGSFDRIDVVDGKATMVRDPGTKAGSLETAAIGKPTGAMKSLYESKGWKVPEMAAGDAWGMATNEYYFMQKEIEELAGASASEKATKLAKRAERLNQALELAGMDPPSGFVAQTQALREGSKFTDEAAEAYLSQLNTQTESTLQRTLKAKMYDDLSRGWHPEWLTGKLEGEALEATVKYAEMRKFQETAFGMNLIGTEKTQQLINNLDLPDYVKNIVGEEYTKAAQLAQDPAKFSQFIDNQASKKVMLIETAEKSGETGKFGSFITEFSSSVGGKIILDSLDAGGRLFMVYDAYKENGWTGAGNRAMLELGVKAATLKGYEMANPALLAWDVSNMVMMAAGNAALNEMRNDNVMGIYTGLIPQRQAGWLFIGLGKDAKPDYTSFFEYLNITSMSDDARSQVRSRLDGNKSFDDFIRKNISWWERATGVSPERREELKDIYVSQANISYMRSQLYDALLPELEKRVAAWEKDHGKQFDYENIAEFDKVSKQLLADKLGAYRANYLGEMSYWQATDAKTWQQIEDMMAKDFLASRGIYQDREQERMKQERLQKEMLEFKDKAGSWLDKTLASLKGETISDSIKNMLNKGFGTGKQETPAPSGGLSIVVSPDTVTEGQQVLLEVTLSPPSEYEIQITIKNLASGAESTSRASLDQDGKLSLTILQISVGNKEAWAGENQVTVETLPADHSIEKQTATATFRVIDYKMTVSIEPLVIVAGDEVTIKVSISPPVEANIDVSLYGAPAPAAPLKTNSAGTLEILIPTKGIDLGWNNDVWVSAEVPSGEGSVTIVEIMVFYTVEPFVELTNVPSNLLTVGDIVTADVRTFHVPDPATKLDVTIINESGYRQTFSAEADNDGRASLSLLQLDPTNYSVWLGENTFTVKASLPSGKKTITAQETGHFTVVKPTPINAPSASGR